MGTPLPRRLGPQCGDRASKTMKGTLARGGRGQGSVGSVEEATAREPTFTPTSLFSEVVALFHPRRKKRRRPPAAPWEWSSR